MILFFPMISYYQMFKSFRVSLPGIAMLLLTSFSGAFAGEWYRGNLHTHSLWSDGNVFPEEAVAWYRDHGYQFLCLSDHNSLQDNPDNWLEIGSKKLSRATADRYLSGYSAGAVSKKTGDKEYLRLKTVWELKKEFEKPGSFLMIPGHELNRLINGSQVHMNAINVHSTIPFRYGSTPGATFQRNGDAVAAAGEEQNTPVLFILNHPTWSYYDISPEVLINMPQLRFYELCNADGGPVFPSHPLWYSAEKFWDIVNAFRIEDGFKPVYGMASDDTHNYTDPGGGSPPGEGWICVNAEELTTESLIQSMYKGDFYSSTGVELENVEFDIAKGTLFVKIHAQAGIQYEIRFITTKAGFDRSTVSFDDPAADKKPARQGIRYSDSIGKRVKSIASTEASYTLEPDDLYVRATVTSSRKTSRKVNNEPENETAWTQPYGWKLWQARNPEKARLTPKK